MTTSPAAPVADALSTPEGTATDPPPRPPQKPLPFDCCESGCARCVFDVYDEELAGYESALAAWRERQRGADDHPDAAGSSGHRDPTLP